MIHFINRLEDNVIRDTDSLFNLTQDISLCSNDSLRFIKEIDHAAPVYIGNKFTGLFQTPYGVIEPFLLSSGTKVGLLVLYYLQHSNADWILSIDSMGDNARGLLFDILNGVAKDITLYCTDYTLAPGIPDIQCTINGSTPMHFSDILYYLE